MKKIVLKALIYRVASIFILSLIVYSLVLDVSKAVEISVKIEIIKTLFYIVFELLWKMYLKLVYNN